MSSRAYEKKERAPVEPVDREELVTLNQRIAEYARARDLEGARSALATLEEKGWANGHTYSAAVHALCRCGDWRAAEEALTRAELRGLFRRGPGLVSGPRAPLDRHRRRRRCRRPGPAFRFCCGTAPAVGMHGPSGASLGRASPVPPELPWDFD